MFDSEFYHEWMKPQGLLDAAALAIDRTLTTTSQVVVVRHQRQGCFADADLHRFNLIYPHLRRAILISRIIDSSVVRADLLHATIDGFAAGVFLLTIRRELCFANAAGAAMAAQGAPVRSVNGRLMVEPPESDRALSEAFRALAVGLKALGGKGMSLPLAGADGADGAAYVAHLLPLDAERRKSLSASEGAAAVLFVRRIDGLAEAATDAFAAQYGLTNQETRVLRAVIDLGGVPLAAELLGVSPATVRTHVTAIFDKTGVRSQAALVRLLVETQSPFAAPR